MTDPRRNASRWVLYAILFVLTSVVVLLSFVVIRVISALVLWVIAPIGLIYAVVTWGTLLLFSVLLLIAWRKRGGWLVAISWGDELGEGLAGARFGLVSSSSPGWAVKLMGWVLLLLPAGVGAVYAFQGD